VKTTAFCFEGRLELFGDLLCIASEQALPAPVLGVRLDESVVVPGLSPLRCSLEASTG